MESAPDIVLASASPRRRRLFGWLGLPFRTAHVETPESLESPLAANPALLAVSLAQEKSAEAHAQGLTGGAIVLTFDTLVALDGAVLGKPADTDDAWRMLRALSGRIHQVHTGCCVTGPGASTADSFAVSTDVVMHDLTDERIREWMAHGEYLGCAGAYNIEGQVASVTEDQCYQNVAGLPLCHVYAALRDLGGVLPVESAERLTSPVTACDAALGRRCTLGPRITAPR